MTAPGGGETVNGRLGGIAVLGDQRDGEILADKAGSQGAKRQSDEKQLQQGGGPAQPHQGGVPPGGPPKGRHGLYGRQHECQNQRQLSDFRRHGPRDCPSHTVRRP